MSLCICVCANDGRVNSIAIPLPFRFPLYFPTIRTKFEEIRKRIALRRRSIPGNEREDKIRFLTRARISKCAQFFAFRFAFVVGNVVCRSISPENPKTHPRRDIDIDRSVVT